MSNLQARYEDVRNRMQPGDVIAFGGKGHFSNIIKFCTRSTVSHVGVILQSKMILSDKPQEGYFNQIIESTSLNGFSGVAISRMSDRMIYDGEIWWLPLSEKVRKKLNPKKYYDFLLHQEHRPYDMPQAIRSALDALDSVAIIGGATLNEEEFSRFFCSELVTAGLEAGGAIGSANSSEVTPIDLCMFAIYQKNYYQLKGEPKVIRGFNSLAPEGWGEGD